MLTRPIDQALDALTACRRHVPFLRDLYRQGSRERAALDELLKVIGQADDALIGGSRSKCV